MNRLVDILTWYVFMPTIVILYALLAWTLGDPLWFVHVQHVMTP